MKDKEKVPFFSNEDGTPVKRWQVPLLVLALLWGLFILLAIWFVFLRVVGITIGMW